MFSKDVFLKKNSFGYVECELDNPAPCQNILSKKSKVFRSNSENDFERMTFFQKVILFKCFFSNVE